MASKFASNADGALAAQKSPMYGRADVSMATKVMTREQVSIRRFKEGDSQKIRSIYRDFFEDTPRHLVASDGFFVASLGPELAGFVLVSYHPGPPDHAKKDRAVHSFCYIEELHVHHKHLCKGIGTALVKKAIKFAREKAADAVYVQTNYWNEPAKATYVKCGFKEHDRIIRYSLPLQVADIEGEGLG